MTPGPLGQLVADDVIYYCYGWAGTDLFGVTNGARAAGVAAYD